MCVGILQLENQFAKQVMHAPQTMQAGHTMTTTTEQRETEHCSDESLAQQKQLNIIECKNQTIHEKKNTHTRSYNLLSTHC